MVTLSQKRQNVKNIFMVVSSNVLTILVALFMGFILPKKMSIEGYAYYRVYMLYIAYAGFFHFGLVNGIYLKYGNLDVEQLPKKVFRTYSYAMALLQALVVAGLSIALFLSGFFMETDKVIAFAFVIINIPLINIKWFYSSINQFTKRFVIDSYVTYLQNALNLVLVSAALLCGWYDYKLILVLLTVCNFVSMVIPMCQNRQILWGERAPLAQTGILPLIKSGFFLMLSEFIGIIILGIDSMFVDNLFSQTDFAMYSFAVSVITGIYTLIGVISNLVYPYLVRVSEDKFAEYYTLMSNMLVIVAVFSMLAFYVVKFIILQWLDKFTPSIPIIEILFGTIVFRTLITLVCGNYFKVLKLIKSYTENNVFAIAMSFALNVAAYLIFRDYHYIAVASLLSFIIWYVVTDRIFIRQLKITVGGYAARYIGILASLAVFYGIRDMEPVRAFILYFACSVVICLLCFHRQIKQLIGIVRGK